MVPRTPILTPKPRTSSRPGFSPKTLAFLRALKRNNRREWFHDRKDQYEEAVHAPMVALVEKLAGEFAEFAPDIVASPRTSLYRIYRDTRFSPDKSPLKTHIGAIFPHRLLPKHEGAGFYVEVAPQHVWFGGGMYMPSSSQLHIVREHIAANHRRLRTLLESPAFRRVFGELDGARLQRVPLGFPKDHPAAEYLKFKQFLAGCEEPAAFAIQPGFYRSLVSAFRTLAPLVAFLNAPLVAHQARDSEPTKWLSTDW